MSSPFKTPEFKELFQKWNTKLAKSGHKEIENFDLPDNPLIDWRSRDLRKVNVDKYLAALTYYSNARSLLHTYEFQNEIHRCIWEMHSEGVSFNKIAKRLNKRRYSKISVFNIVKKILKDSK